MENPVSLYHLAHEAIEAYHAAGRLADGPQWDANDYYAKRDAYYAARAAYKAQA